MSEADTQWLLSKIKSSRSDGPSSDTANMTQSESQDSDGELHSDLPQTPHGGMGSTKSNGTAATILSSDNNSSLDTSKDPLSALPPAHPGPLRHRHVPAPLDLPPSPPPVAHQVHPQAQSSPPCLQLEGPAANGTPRSMGSGSDGSGVER